MIFIMPLQALGCVPSVPGYFKAMKAVCDKYGALLILDEIMCGMGRTGTAHAWQQEGVIPDIQTIGKGYVLFGAREHDIILEKCQWKTHLNDW